jgi:adenylate cyclase
MADPGDDLAALEKENRALGRKLARVEANLRESEAIHHANSKLLSKLTQELEEERAKSLALLRNILPQPIIDRLEAGEGTIADRYDSVTVLFSDLVGFTEISSSLEPDSLVAELNRLFSRFDALCEEHGVEKIKTIGDAYFAVGGLSGTRSDHEIAVARLALGMREAVREIERERRTGWRIRIGIHTGPAVAGVIGTRKFVYDVWGDTVNVASRLETSADPDTVHVSEPVAEALRGSFGLEPRGLVVLKGKGEVRTFVLGGRRAEAE